MRISLVLTLATMALATTAQTLSWQGAVRQPVSVAPQTQAGLDVVAVADGVDGLTAVFECASPTGVSVSTFGHEGAAYAEPLEEGVSHTATAVSIANLRADRGYMLSWSGGSYTFYLIDYSATPLTLRSVTPAAEQDNCALTALDVDGTGAEMAYYGITGRRFTVDREIEVAYTSQTYSESAQAWTDTSVSKRFDSLSPTLRVDAPLCATTFTISGDRFLRAWGEETQVESAPVTPRAVDAHVDAEQATRDADNEVTGSTGQMGGSAPCDVAFSAAVTDGALFTEWQFARNADFEDITLRITDLVFDYSFTEEGTTYVRFVCADDSGDCQWESQPFEVSIGASMLKCPNAFSPENQDGVNDIWKVSYSSIVDFECSIFNRSGHCIVTFNDPASGWDGRYGGKFVSPGVYFYVIKARGADGKKYNLSGDINIVGYK